MKIWKPILSPVIFLIAQFIAGIAVAILCIDWAHLLDNGMGEESQLTVNATEEQSSITEAIAWANALSGIISVLVIWLCLKSIRLHDTFTPRNANIGSNWFYGALAIVGAAFGIVSINILSEQMQLPNIMEDQFIELSSSVVGALSIAVIAPVVEELVFRESITGYLLRNGCKPWIAILSSSLIFGIIHLNPAQIPFATIIGIILGILYWKTGNVILCTIVHIANNSQAVIEMDIMGEASKDYTITEALEGEGAAWGYTIGTLTLCIICMWVFCRYYKRTQLISEDD